MRCSVSKVFLFQIHRYSNTLFRFSILNVLYIHVVVESHHDVSIRAETRVDLTHLNSKLSLPPP